MSKKMSSRMSIDSFLWKAGWRRAVLLTLAAVLLPTIGILWFMMKAVKNERLAVRQRLEEFYKGQFNEVSRLIDEWCGKVLSELERAENSNDPWEIRQILTAPNDNIKKRIQGKSGYEYVPTTLCDSYILQDNEGNLIYPILPALSPREKTAPEWEKAWELEFEQQNFEEAAEFYLELAKQPEAADISARALMSAARCLVKAGKTEAAIEILTQNLIDTNYLSSLDETGSLIRPAALLLALQIMDKTHPEYRNTRIMLENMLPNQKEPFIPTPQRIFIVKELKEMGLLQPNGELFMDNLSMEYMEKNPAKPDPGVLVKVPHANMWHMASKGDRIIALFDESRTLERIFDYSRSHSTLSDLVFVRTWEERRMDKAQKTKLFFLTNYMKFSIVPPGENPPDPQPYSLIPPGKYFPGWRLAFYLNDSDIFSFTAAQSQLLYLWYGALFILLVFVITFLLVRYMENQMRLAQLRNNLIATVSHELKTPLSSMRVLVDTLLEERYEDQKQVKEYLELISRENLRLSRLIDNFLTFSRMERNKKAFDLQEVKPEEIIREAMEAMKEKFDSTGAEVKLEIANNLPRIMADRDAMITVLVNLLDNACKYTKDQKRIIIRTFKEGQNLCFQVEDNGIGIPPRALKKIFDRFYQVDQTLARKTGGCGLGLSIVKFIMEGHGGSVDVKSAEGRGSTFTLKLPAQNSERKT